MGLGNYLVTVGKLKNIGRWSNEFMHRRSNVSEHSFMTTQVGQMLAFIEEEHGNEVNWKLLFFKLPNHDVTETLTSDILSEIKNENPHMKNMIKNIEKQLTNRLILSVMDEPYRSIYARVLFEGKDATLEGQILRSADDIDALIECVNEIKLANYYPFLNKYYDIYLNLQEATIVSVKYFMETILPEIIEGIPVLHENVEENILAAKDRKAEKLWRGLKEISFEEEDGIAILTTSFHIWKAGVSQQDIHQWFNENHSQGLSYLLNKTI